MSRATFILPEFYPEPIGGYIVVYQYANYLSEQGWAVNIVYGHALEDSRQSLRSQIRRKRWRLKTFMQKRPLVPWFKFHSRVCLILIDKWSAAAIPNADVVIATAWQTATPVSSLPPVKGAKFYLVQHYEVWGGPKALVDATFLLPMTIIAISQWLASITHQLGAHSVTHIPNGLDHQKFMNLGLPRDVGILSLYHHANFKGVSDALQAFDKLHKTFPEVKIVMFGIPDRGPEIADWIEYIQDPEQPALVELYNRARIYVSASLAEGWALPPAEAMACGCLFVGTDSGGCRDFAENGVTALLSPPSDPDTLYENLVHAVTHENEVDAIRQNGIENIANFTWANSGQRLLKLFTAKVPKTR